MRKLKVWLQSALFVLLALLTISSGRAWGQDSWASSYTTYSSDGTLFCTTVVTEGDITYDLEGMEHTYYAFNQLSNPKTGVIAGGMETGGPSANFVEVVNDQYTPFDGDTIDWEYDSEVYCPIMGWIYNSGGSGTATPLHSTYQLSGRVPYCKTCIPPTYTCTYQKSCSNADGVACGTSPSTQTHIESNPPSGCSPYGVIYYTTVNGVCTQSNSEASSGNVPCK